MTGSRVAWGSDVADAVGALSVAPEGSGEAAPAPAAAAPKISLFSSVPRSFDGYELVRPIGRGGMGEVYLAQDTVLDRPVAVKVIASLEPGALARERFLREARAIARLQHPNVVAVYRAGEVAGLPYLVSELVRGGSLDRLPLPLVGAQLLHVCTGLASGLAAAHRRGVLHRDLKPANALMSDDGEVKLCDFGLAKLLGLADGEAPAAPGIDAGLSGSGELTRAGAWLGTPRYMAPELWRSEPATIRTDLYSLGAMFYKLASGQGATSGANVEELRQAALAGAIRPLAEVVPALDRHLCAIVDRCLALDPSGRPASADEVFADLVALATPAAAAPPGNPYRGLRAFDAEHRALFFGRRAESLAVVELLRSDALVVVAGDSGVGKSSLCRAGVLPLVADGALHEDRAWTSVRLVPGRHPIAELTRALAPLVEGGEAGLAAHLGEDPRAVARRLRAGLGPSRGVLLLVDQLEELVTEADPGERDAAALALAELASRIPGVRVLATARGDFLTRLAALPGLGQEMSRALYLLGPLDRAQLREVIVGPARTSGLGFESEALVDTLVAAAGASPAALPLLQFALAELWERRDPARAMIPAAALDAIGGVDGALARHADGVLATMAPAERKLARRLLTQLVTVEGTRAYRGEAELVGDDDLARAALGALVRGRLLAVHSDDDGQSIYEVAHEALLSGWTTLRAWLDRDAERRAVHERLAAAASEWERLDGARSVLWGAPQLAEAARVDLAAAVAGGRDGRFLDASVREARARARRRRALIVAAPLFVAALWGGLALETKLGRNRAVATQLELARPKLATAGTHAATALGYRSAAFVQFDAGRNQEGERLWALARKANEAAEAAYAQATRPVETALQLDGTRRDTLDTLAGSLYARAALAEIFYDKAKVAELIDRLRWLDSTGAWIARWNAPASLRIETSPPGGRLTVRRYETTDDGHRVPGAPLMTGVAPLEARLPHGSYLILAEADDRPPVRYPVLLERGRELVAAIPMPRHVPPKGFAFIPSGRFMFGTDEVEDRRLSLLATPQRAVFLPSFVIATHEVTWGEWLEFLSTRPFKERLERRPRGDKLELEVRSSGYALRMKPSSVEYTEAEGQPVVYPDRDRRQRQDWSQFPVAATTIGDGKAFARWLDESGRVPRARFCTDREWERAARGADDRQFPNGDQLADDDANFDVTYGRRPGGFGPDEVGSHPASDSPFAVADLAGNVWEFVMSSTDPQQTFIRGGAFYEERRIQKSTNSGATEPMMRDPVVGLRICADWKE
jgi:formylglycine-generating enzyme required for sulfatase activity